MLENIISIKLLSIQLHQSLKQFRLPSTPTFDHQHTDSVSAGTTRLRPDSFA